MSTDAIDVSTIIRGIRRLRPNGQVVAKNHARTSRPAVLNNRDSVFKRLRARPIKREAIAINRWCRCSTDKRSWAWSRLW